MSAYRRKFNEKVLVHRSRLRRFLTKLENNLPRGYDAIAVEVDREVWAEVDCLACSNCCRAMTPTYTPADLKRISAHLGMTVDAFKEKWLFKDRKGEWMNRTQPCQFLDKRTNMCSIYPIRPADCAGFPHLAKKPAKTYMHIHKANVQYCPATFTFVEKMIERVGKL
ncbi:YkgJ family cysteine cluster protein [Flaviaesturariibacter flavus]|uniref:YkgJ family cysteine cluster protein n=1 Tax=Flaviaesturariibacter flavus TaxID=2502780 RepID=A0A4R1B644_9BACT|nr:YkgJ family cysteine cluster protein [Flaviaesturariibacter flavus]TCJ12047.1 YkgJ family cysteine cluster protein [Flaviaesturariibacter flavus]